MKARQRFGAHAIVQNFGHSIAGPADPKIFRASVPAGTPRSQKGVQAGRDAAGAWLKLQIIALLRYCEGQAVRDKDDSLHRLIARIHNLKPPLR